MLKRLSSAFLILLVSRIIGIVREILVSIAFGFSRVTDLFYQSSFPLQLILTVAMGPFVTAFSARLAASPASERIDHILYYSRRAPIVGAAISGCLAVMAGACVILGMLDWRTCLVIGAAIVPAVPALVWLGYVYSLCVSYGRIASAAALMLVTNAVFVALVATIWLSGLQLTFWMLPTSYTVGALAALPFSWHLYKRIVAIARTDADGKGQARPLSKFMRTFLWAGIETSFFMLTQFVVLVLATNEGHGWASAVSVVQRVAFSINGLITSPAASLIMLRMIVLDTGKRAYFVRSIGLAALFLAGVGGALAFIIPLMIHDFVPYKPIRAETLMQVSSLLPAYALWTVPMGINIIVCRVMFGLRMERAYTLTTVGGYALAIAARMIAGPHFGLAGAITAGALVEILGVVALSLFVISRMRNQHAC